jgi:hypothetical protein
MATVVGSMGEIPCAYFGERRAHVGIVVNLGRSEFELGVGAYLHAGSPSVCFRSHHALASPTRSSSTLRPPIGVPLARVVDVLYGV